MKSLKLEKGDLKLESGNFQLVEGKEEVKQRLMIEIETNEGEWFLNTNFGLPWIEAMKNNDADRLAREIRKVVSRDGAIESIESFESDYDPANRELRINFVAIIAGEEVEFEEVI